MAPLVVSPLALYAAPVVGSSLLALLAPALVHWRSSHPLGSVGYACDCKRAGNRGVFLSAVLCAAAWLLADRGWLVLSVVSTSGAAVPLASLQPVERVLAVLPFTIPLVATLLYCVIAVALERGADPQAVSGTVAARQTNPALDLALRKLQNTLEQAVIAALAHLAAAAVVPPSWLSAVIAHQGLWLAGRVLFLSGYTLENPLGREFGFDMTLTSSASCVAVALYFWLVHPWLMVR